MQRPAILRSKSRLEMPISPSACAMMEQVWILGSSHGVSGPAIGDFPECASAARALAVTSMFGVRPMRVRKSSFASPLKSHTHSPGHPYPVDLEAFFLLAADCVKS